MPNENHNPPHIVYTAEEVAALLKISTKSVYRLLDRQLLHASKALRHKRISAKSLEFFIKETTGGAL